MKFNDGRRTVRVPREEALDILPRMLKVAKVYVDICSQRYGEDHELTLRARGGVAQVQAVLSGAEAGSGGEVEMPAIWIAFAQVDD